MRKRRRLGRRCRCCLVPSWKCILLIVYVILQGWSMLSLFHHWNRTERDDSAVSFSTWNSLLGGNNDDVVVVPKTTAAHTSPYRTCRVAITNAQPFHYETLESIGTLLPLRFLQAAIAAGGGASVDATTDQRMCTHWVFDLHLLHRKTPRFSPWIEYYTKSVQGTTVVHSVTQDSSRIITRTWGELVLYRSNGGSSFSLWSFWRQRGREWQLRQAVTAYDVTVEASCYCDTKRGLQHLRDNPHQICIFHQACPPAMDDAQTVNRSVWLNPHFPHHYYLPTALPKIPPSTRASLSLSSTSDPLHICVTGNIERRQWSLLQQYLEQEEDEEEESGQKNNASVPFEIYMFSSGDTLPSPLQNYSQRIRWIQTDDYVEFHARIVHECHALAFLVTRRGNPQYFRHLQKLTGSMPLVVAYQLPYVVHADLYHLYRHHLPTRGRASDRTLPFATHQDDAASFVRSMSEFLPQLREYYVSINAT